MAKSKSTKPTKKTDDKKQPPVVIDNTKLKLTLPWKNIQQEYQSVLTKAAKNIKSGGFRQGKVPLKIAEEKIGRDKLINQVLENIVPAKYQELLTAEKKQHLTQPEIRPLKLDWGNDFELEIQIAEKPTIELGEYKKAIKTGLKEAAKQLKETKKTQEKSKKAENKKNKDTQDKKQEDHHEHGHDHHHHDHQNQERETKMHQVFKALVEAIQPQIPELLLKEETRRELHRLTQELEKIGLTLDDYLTKRQIKFEEMSSQVAAQVLGQLQLELVLEALEVKLAIKATKKELEQEIEKITDEKIKKQIQGNPQYQVYLEKQITRKKLLDSLVEEK
jgi:FKBP-type peptidyl-prolyl cis-trans isomerase (trigger factor)